MDKEEVEAINLKRIRRLLEDKGGDAFRTALHVIHPPSTLAQVLNENKRALQNLRYTVIQPWRWKLLFPASGTPDSKTFDITLLTILLRTICGLRPPATGLNVMPPDSDTSISANIARIEIYRKQFCGNVPRTQIDDKTFEALWQEISKTLVNLGIPQQDIDELKEAPFTSEDKSPIKELQEWKEKEDEPSKLGDDQQEAGASALSAKDFKTMEQEKNEAINFDRVFRLLVDKGGDALRAALHVIHPPSSLAHVLNENKRKLRKLRFNNVITPRQWTLLFSATGTTDSKAFDITLLTVLLRTICGLQPPATGWFVMPPDSDNSISANIARIKVYRKQLGHNIPQARMDDKTFKTLWQEISKTLVNLGVPEQDIDELKEAPFTSEHQRPIEELQEWKEKENEPSKFGDDQQQAGASALSAKTHFRREKSMDDQDKAEAMNFFRLSRLLVDKGKDALRSVLHVIHPPPTLAHVLNAKRKVLQSLRNHKIITLWQWESLFPVSGKPDSKTFDISLLTILLRNICGLPSPATGWNVMPLPSDTSISADILRIKMYRNEVLIHPSRATIDDKTFDILWEEITRTLIRLGIPPQEIDELKEVFSITEESYTEELQEWKEREDDLSRQRGYEQEVGTSVLSAKEKCRLALLYSQKGYDEERFETPISKDMTCVICKGVLNNPKGCCNGHFFCSNCITRHLLKTTSCPLCRQTLTPEILQDPPHDLAHSLSELHIRCDYQERGCNVVVLLKDLQNHVDECEFAPKDPVEMFEKLKILEYGDGKDLGTASAARPKPQKRETLKALTVEKHDVIVLGGCLISGNSINSVEMYIFTERTWIELPPMITPRSKLSSVLVDNEIVVSGGDIGADATASIEIMKLNETPPCWRMSDATLPVPLSGHCTVVYRGKLIVIGGYDGYTGRISNKIYEISLIPIYSWRNLGALPRAISGHGAELVDGKIFIFGGGNIAGIPNNQVWVYNLTTNECSPMPPLPYPMLGMATVRWGRKVILLGGVGTLEQELDDVILYNTQTGETRNVSKMRQRRGGCSAVLTADILIALGSLHSDKTVECSRVTSSTWDNLTNTNDAREFCAAVVSPVNLQG